MVSWNGNGTPGFLPKLVLLQWGHDDGVVEWRSKPPRLTPWRGFNGATTMVSWNGCFLIFG